MHAILREYTLLNRDTVLQSAHGMTRWRYNPETKPWATRLSTIYGGAHVIGDGTGSGMTFFANPHIDVNTWNQLQTTL